MKLSVEVIDALPHLAWACAIDFASDSVRAFCGPSVEVDEGGIIAGSWAGRFGDRNIEGAATSVGTALRMTDYGVLLVVGTASPSPVFLCRTRGRLSASNSLSLALVAAGDQLRATFPFYVLDMATYYLASDRFRREVPTENGRLAVLYGSTIIRADCSIRLVPQPEPPTFGDFASYRALLVSETRALLANAADRGRSVRYLPLVSLSAGYDFPAVALIGRDAGCHEGFTFGQAVDNPSEKEDSGWAIGRLIGLSMTELDTYAYKARRDLPEVEFAASSFSGGQVYFAGTESIIRGRIVLSGFGGDRIWAMDFGRAKDRLPFYIGGYSQIEFFLRAPAMDLAIPVIGAGRAATIGEISRSFEMQPWSIGGTYDRPIPRRIVEEAGVARGAFAQRKRRITPDYDSFTRRAPDLDRFLSPHSTQAFETWFAREQPLKRAGASRHALVSHTIGRVIWSGKLTRALKRVGIRWPPFRVRLLRLKVPIRKNAFLFAWAVAEQQERYRSVLQGTGSFHRKLKLAVSTDAVDT